jgi:hypothetical protein
MTLYEIDEQINFETIADGENACRLNAGIVVSLLQLTTEMSESDANIAYFVSGFAARSTIGPQYSRLCSPFFAGACGKK